MADRSPATLQQLSAAHIQAAARQWDPDVGVPTFSSTTPWMVDIDGHLYPTKAIVALAHSLAELGTLTSDTLAGAAARARLEELGFTLQNHGELPDTTPVAPPAAADSLNFGASLRRHLPKTAVQAHHVEAAARSLAIEGHAEKFPAHTGTHWLVMVGAHWFGYRNIVRRAAELSGLPEIRDTNLTEPQGRKWRDRLRTLGYRFNREEKPLEEWTATNLRAAARRFQSGTAPADARDALEIFIDGKGYPTTVLQGADGETPHLGMADLAHLEQMNVPVFTRPDPVDLGIDQVLRTSTLPTEVRRQITARIGQGFFRDTLLSLHQRRCVVTGVRTEKALRAAHIKRWADCADSPTERLDPQNGLLLSANLDCLFEHGLIAFTDTGEILIADALDEEARAELGLHEGLRLATLPSPKQRQYLAFHRARTGW